MQLFGRNSRLGKQTVPTMTSITFGGIEISSQGFGVAVAKTGNTAPLATLNTDEVIELLDFLTSLPDGPMNVQRQDFRVPVAIEATSEITVEVTKKGKTHTLEPKNISATGIFVCIDPKSPLLLAKDEEVALMICHNDESVACRASVRRVETHGYGLLFRDAVAEDGISPAPALLKIVMDLQRAWLKQRSES